jgi:hypothetical protein
MTTLNEVFSSKSVDAEGVSGVSKELFSEIHYEQLGIHVMPSALTTKDVMQVFSFYSIARAQSKNAI